MAVYQIYEGRRYSPECWAAAKEWRRLAEAEGIPFRITQAGHNAGLVAASGASHDGDALDVSTRGLTKAQVARLVELGRMVGFAVWFRTSKTAKYGTRAQGFAVEHIHAVPNKWGHPSKYASEQATSYRNGRDGLLSDQKDIGPGHVSKYRTRTWAEYKQLNTQTIPKEPEMSEPLVRKVVREELDNYFNKPRTAGGETKPFILHILGDAILNKAQSVALASMQGQINAVADKLGVKIDQSKAAILAGVNAELDKSIHQAMAEHFPSMEKAEADDIANTIFELLVAQLAKE